MADEKPTIPTVEGANTTDAEPAPGEGAALYSPEKEVLSGKCSVDYKLIDRIGTGAFSEVWRASVIAGGSKHDGAYIAVKEIDAVRLHKEGRCDPQRVVSEIQILARLRHPNIVRMYAARITEEKKLHLLMEFCNKGELFDHIIERQSYTEGDAVEVMRQVLQAVAHLHAHDIIHRDIKPENVLVHQLPAPAPLVFKLSDFGLAKLVKFESEIDTNVSQLSSKNTVCGTPTYSAPEVWTGMYSHNADCFSTGVLMFVLLSGHFPAFKNQQPILPQADWAQVSSTARDLLFAILVHDPAKRLSAQRALEHAWFKSEPPPTPLPSAQLQLKQDRQTRHSPAFVVEREAPPILAAPPPKRPKSRSPGPRPGSAPSQREESTPPPEDSSKSPVASVNQPGKPCPPEE